MRALFVFLKYKAPYPGFAGTSPMGEDQGCVTLPPLGEVARSDVGGLVLLAILERRVVEIDLGE